MASASGQAQETPAELPQAMLAPAPEALAPVPQLQANAKPKALFGVEGLEALGVGLAGVNYYAYRGAVSRRTMVLPFPYVRYEGPVLKADRDGLRGQFFRDDRFDISLSASLSPPVSSSVAERAGMPGLKPTLELGPQLDMTLWKAATGPGKLRLRLPIRQAFTVQGPIRDAGWIVAPNLNLDLPVAGWMWGTVAGPIWANQRQHGYFYDVAPAYATSERPSYRASGGYSGSTILTSLSRKMPGHWLAGYVRYDDWRGAAFAQSPLVKKRGDWVAGLAWAWVHE